MSERMHPAVEAVSRVLDDYNAQCAAQPKWTDEHPEIVGAVRNMIDRCRGAVARAVRSTVAEPTVPVPVSLIERAEGFDRRGGLGSEVHIADMVPGTTFRLEARSGMFMRTTYGAVHTSGVATSGLTIDPSTIRDVTPPKEKP